MPEMSEQRRLQRVLDAGYLDGLAALEVEELEARRTECVELETEASFVRRLAQGRLDILAAEQERRRSGGSFDDLIGSLAQILADDGPRPDPAQGHLPQLLAPSPLIEWTRGLEPLVGDATLVRLPDLGDDELDSALSQLQDLEREVSAVRHSLHHVLDTIDMEMAQRIQAGRP